MAATNYRKNLIKNGRAVTAPDVALDWTPIGGVTVGTGSPNYFIIPPNAGMTQIVTLPKVYPTKFTLSAEILENGSATGDVSNFFFVLAIGYTDKETLQPMVDHVMIPATNPIASRLKTQNGGSWSCVITTHTLREMPADNTGYALDYISVQVLNRGTVDGYITNIQAYPSNVLAPTNGAGVDVAGASQEYTLEFASGDLVGSDATFTFTTTYDDVTSVAVSTIGPIGADVALYTTILRDTNNLCTGVKVTAVGTVPAGTKISLQAICYTAPIV